MRKWSKLIFTIILMLSILSTSTVSAKQTTVTFINPEYEGLEALSKDMDEIITESPLFRFEKDGKYGLINESGKVIAKAEYESIWGDASGFAIVRKDGKTGYMNPEGKLITKFQYDEYGCSGFYDGLAHVVKDGKHGFINTSGKTIVPLKYEDATDYADGAATVMLDGKWGVVNKKGEVIVKPKYAQIGYVAQPAEIVVTFVEGIAQIQTMEGKWGYIDVNGKEVVKPEYDEAYDSRNGFAPFVKDGKMGLATKKGVALKPVYDFIYDFTASGVTFFVQDKKLGIINNKLKVIAKAQYASAKEISPEGYMTVKKGDKYGVVDKNGKVIIKPQYDDLGTFYNGMARVILKDKIGYINLKNNLVIPAEYEVIDDWYNSFALGTAIIKKDGKYGIITKTGKYAAKPEYQSIYSDSVNQLYIVNLNDKYGVLDAAGKVILKPEYTNIETIKDIIIASKDSSSQLFNTEGKLISDATYENLRRNYSYYSKLVTFTFQKDGKYGAVTYHYH